MDPDQRPIEQQVLEAARTVVGDHHVGRRQIRADVGARREHAAPGRSSGRSRAAQSTPPEYCGRRSRERSCSFTITLTGIARSRVDQIDAHRVQRRRRRPGRRVQHGRPRRDEAEGRSTASRRSDPSTRQSTFGMPIRRIAGLSASSAPAATQFAAGAVDEEQAVPRAHRVGRRVEPVLAADAVKHLDAAGACEQPRPGEVGREVGVELRQRRGGRTDDARVAAGVAKDLARLLRLIARDERRSGPARRAIARCTGANIA